MIAKDGDLLCPEVLEFARTEPCYVCGKKPADGVGSDPQHFPPKGSSGVTRDDLIYPACRDDHDAAHGIKVIVNGVQLPIPSHKQQERLVQRFRLRFMQYASNEQFEAFARARREWLARRQIAF